MAHLDLSIKIAKQFELIATSFHEAGHTIYALLNKIKVLNASISFNKETKRIEGCCEYLIPDFSIFKDFQFSQFLAEYEIGIKYAGLTAEKYHFKTISGSDKFPLFLRDGSSDDTMSAATLIKKYSIAPPGKKRYQFKKNKIKEILKTLQENWNDVSLISHSLFAKKKLSFQDLKYILTKKSQNKKFWKNQFKIIDSIFNNLEEVDEQFLKIKFGV
jgi:hypothetical protein